MVYNKERLFEFDFFRGVAIILVVCGHVISKNFDGAIDNHPIYTWIYSFHMPLFFFISGFLVHYTAKKRKVWRGLIKKLSLIVSYLIWCYLLAPFVNKGGLPTLFYVFVETHGYYWFVYLLFLLSVMFYVGQMVFPEKQGVWVSAIIGLLFFGIAQMLYPCEVFCRSVQFFPIYTCGMIASAYQLNAKEKMFKEPVVSIAIVLFLLCSISYCHLDSSLLNKTCKMVAALTICYIILYFINRQIIRWNNKVVELVSYMGKNSIVIYLTHFFFISIVPIRISYETTIASFWSFFVSLVASVVIIAFCLLIGRIAENFKWVNRIVYGREW